jgi:hypothetical protein
MATAVELVDDVVDRVEVFDLEACRVRAVDSERLLFRSVFAPRTRMNPRVGRAAPVSVAGGERVGGRSRRTGAL